MGSEQIHSFRFLPSVDMTDVTNACTESHPVPSTDAGNGRYEGLSRPAIPCHQIDYSSDLSRAA